MVAVNRLEAAARANAGVIFDDVQSPESRCCHESGSHKQSPVFIHAKHPLCLPASAAQRFGAGVSIIKF